MNKALTSLVSGLLLATPLAIAVAPPAAAGGCSDASIVNGDVCDTTETDGPKPTSVRPTAPPNPNPNPNPNPGSGTVAPHTDGTWDRVKLGGGALWMWEDGYVLLYDHYGAANYENLWTYAQCSAPKGYTDPPLGGTTINARAGFYLRTTTTFLQTTDVNGVVTNTELAQVQARHGYCLDYTTPTETQVPLSQIATVRIQGPFDFDGQPMRGENLNGKLTRDSDNDGVPSVDGKTITGMSILGDAVYNRVGSEDAVKRTPATIKEAYDLAIRTGEDLSLFKSEPEILSDHGRYVAVQHIWRSIAHTYYFSSLSSYIPNIYPQLVAREKGVRYWSTSGGGAPVYIDRVTGPVEVRQVVKFRITCTSAQSEGALFRYDLVEGPVGVSSWSGMDSSWANGMPSQVDRGWRDDPTTYTYKCSDGTPPPEKRPPMADLLRCGPYETVTVVPRDLEKAPVTSHQETRSGTRTWQEWDAGGGGNVPAPPDGNCGAMGGGWSLQSGNGHWRCIKGGMVTRSENYSYTVTVTDPAPFPNATQQGGLWVRDGGCPAGSVANPDGTTCTQTKASAKVWVDGVPAAPLEQVDSYLAPANTGSGNVTYEAFTAADSYRLGWERPRMTINVGSYAGKNVNSLPASSDTRWERMWFVDPSKASPVLKSGAKRDGAPTIRTLNENEAPVHGFTDRTNDSVDDRPSAATDWLPTSDPQAKDSASWSRWVGFDINGMPNSAGWEDTQRALWTRFYQAQSYGSEGWTVTPMWRVTTTIPSVTFDKVTGWNMDSNGNLSPVTTRVTEDIRDSYVCPGQPVTFATTRVIN